MFCGRWQRSFRPLNHRLHNNNKRGQGPAACVQSGEEVSFGSIRGTLLDVAGLMMLLKAQDRSLGSF